MSTVRLLVLAIVAIAVIAIGTAAPRQTEAGAADPEAVVEDFFANVDEGDIDGAVALLAEDFIFTQIDDEGSFAVVGKPAFAIILEDVVALNNTTVLTDLATNGNVVTGVAEFSDDESDAAGVDRYLQPFTITLNDAGLVTKADFTYDTTDQQTAEYLEYQASQEEDGEDEGPPPGSVTVALAAQPGGNQPGEAFIFEEDGVTFVGLTVEPGPADVLQPAHFHTGTCAAPGPIVEPLAMVLNGESFTILSAAQAELVDTGLIINVHKSVAESSVYVSCGQVLSAPAPAPTAAPTTAPPAPAPTATVATGVTAPDTGNGGDTPGTNADWLAIVALLTSAAAIAAGVGVAGRRGHAN
jgi:hypothetical protein